MKLNEINSDLIMKMGLMNNIVKKQSGDGIEFQIMLQTMLESMGKVEDDKINNKIMTTSVGEKLENLKLVLNNKESYNNKYWNSKLEISSNNKETTKVENTNKVDYSNMTDVKKEIYKSVDKYSKMYGVDKNLVLAVIKAESNFNPKCISSAGAMGVMQLMPVTAKEEGVTDPYNIDQNIRGGVSQLRKHLKRYNGNVEMALMGYNAGDGTVQRRGVKTPSDIYKMPKETQNYVPKVLKYYREFKV